MNVTYAQYDTKLFGYLIVISPSKEVADYVSACKSDLHKEYGNYPSQHSDPHITICNYPLLEERQYNVLIGLQKGLISLEPFTLKLKDFGSFPGSNVIFVDIEESGDLKKLREILYVKNVHLWISKKFFLFTKPHLTIAKQLKPYIFDKVRSDYCGKSYQKQFWVDHLAILRYDFDQGRYTHIGDLRLGNQSGQTNL